METDERMRAGERLWAIGDITGKGAFTHMSMYQAAVAVRDILGQDGPPADYRAVPPGDVHRPEVGVGRPDRGAGARRRASTSGPALAEGPESAAAGSTARHDGLIKLVADASAGSWSGPPWSARPAARCSSMLVTAVHAEVPVATLRSMHYAYPTFHRAVESAVGGGWTSA